MAPTAAPTIPTGGMSPAADRLPTVLPTERLTERGRAVPEVRAPLRRIHGVRNAAAVTWIWVQAVGMVALATWIAHPLAWLVVFVLMTRVIVLCSILTHEAAHRTLFARKSVNDFVGRWLLSYPVFIPLDAYRRSHMAHHRDAFGPEEPDVLLYGNYPIPRASLRRKLVRDAFFVSGLKMLRGLVRALRSRQARPIALRIFGTQAVLWIVFALAGAWWVYPLFWLTPWLTSWRVIARLRAIAEHGGLERSDDERQVTHHVHQSFWAGRWFVPFNTGYHLAHHLDPGLPYTGLRPFHGELVEAGYVPSELVYPSYRALWKAQASG